MVIAGLYVVLVLSEVVNPHSGSPTTALEWFGIGLITATCGAMLAAWQWELPGVVTSLAAQAAFALLFHGGQSFLLTMLAVATPGILYLAGWAVRRRRIRRPTALNG